MEVSIINNVVSYKTKIINANKIFDDTVQIYRKALSFIINVVNNEWKYISPLKTKQPENSLVVFIVSIQQLEV